MIANKRTSYLIIATICAAFLAVFYALVYRLEPFTELWNTFWIDGSVVIAAGLAAFSASLLRTMFERDDPPRSVWTHFALALWIWALAEAVWMFLDLFVGDYEFSVADGLWMLGYIFLAIAISAQYRILYRWGFKKRLVFLLGGLGLVALLAVGISFVFSEVLDLGTVVWYFYPIADFFFALTILWLVVTFHGSTLAVPWLGLFALIISDALYLWALQTEIYWIPGGLPRLLVDMAYVFAYLLFALGCYAQYLLYRLSKDTNRANDITNE